MIPPGNLYHKIKLKSNLVFSVALFDPIKFVKSDFMKLLCLFQLSVQVQTETCLWHKGGDSKDLVLEGDSVR